MNLPPAYVGWMDDTDPYFVNGAIASPVMVPIKGRHARPPGAQRLPEHKRCALPFA